jgi:hypothetical protein
MTMTPSSCCMFRKFRAYLAPKQPATAEETLHVCLAVGSFAPELKGKQMPVPNSCY